MTSEEVFASKMELVCIGVIFLWAVVFGLVGVSASFITNNAYVEESVKHAFPPSSYDVFINSDKITFYSLNTTENESGGQFHGYDFNATLELDAEHRQKLKEAFIKTADFRSLTKHFEPCCGLRLEQGTEFVDILISFKNSTFYIYFKDKKRVGSFFKSSENGFRQIIEKIDFESSSETLAA